MSKLKNLSVVKRYLDKDKDGDIDGKYFAMLRKQK